VELALLNEAHQGAQQRLRLGSWIHQRDRLAVGDISDQQAQFLDIAQLVGDGFEAGEEEVPDGELGCVTAGQDALQVVQQRLVAVIYDVMGHGTS
jgi:hypothetical protein